MLSAMADHVSRINREQHLYRPHPSPVIGYLVIGALMALAVLCFVIARVLG